jgi:phage anti-repressor protein
VAEVHGRAADRGIAVRPASTISHVVCTTLFSKVIFPSEDKNTQMEQITSHDDAKGKREALIRFLKRYTPVSDAFVDDFFALADPASSKKTFAVDAEAAARWLKMTKGNLMRALRRYGFAEGKDYSDTVERPAAHEKRPNRRPIHNILMTTECFKGVCMMLNTPKSKEVRGYFIAAEETLLRYREELEAGLRQRILELERNQRGPGAARRLQGAAPGVIYIVRAAPDASVYKIGRTKDLATRLRSHEAALAHGLEILFVFKTANMKEVEGCVKSVLQSFQYKKYKEVYQTDLDTIKSVVASCEDICSQVKNAVGQRAKPATISGGGPSAQHFIIMFQSH